MSATESWNDKFGDKVKTEDPAPRAGKYDYELNVAYPVRVSAAKIIETKRKEICLQLDVDIMLDGAAVGSSREWFTLPKQVTDGDKAVVTVRKLTFRRRDDLQRIMATTENSAFRKYYRREERDGKYVYFDRDDKEMTGDDFRSREIQVNTLLMDTTDQWHDMVGETLDVLEGAEFYIVKAPNQRNAQYPYTNIYSHKPDKIPLFGEVSDDEDDTPF